MTEVSHTRRRAEAIGETALLAKLDARRQSLAAPFAPERIDLVASVAETLLGPAAARRLRRNRPFRLLDPPRRADEARRELHGAGA